MAGSLASIALVSELFARQSEVPLDITKSTTRATG